MALPLCTCSPKCVTPATCDCVFEGLRAMFPVRCSRCGEDDWGLYPVGWRMVKVVCVRCRHEGWITQRMIDNYLGGADWDLSPEVEQSK